MGGGKERDKTVAERSETYEERKKAVTWDQCRAYPPHCILPCLVGILLPAIFN